MPLQIVHQDITKIKCDAIVNPTDGRFSGSGGTDSAIHIAAGVELDKACERLNRISFGEVAVTNGYNLPHKYIIHTVGPVWKGGNSSETVLLRSCYVNALMKAKQLGVESVAFPLISAGTFSFPKDKVLRIAIDAISDFLFTVDSELIVYICVLDRNSFELSKGIALKEYIAGNRRFIYQNHTIELKSPVMREEEPERDVFSSDNGSFSESRRIIPYLPKSPKALSDRPTIELDLAQWIKKQDDTFPVLLLKLIDKKGMDDVECYKKANVHKNVFWKIKNDPKHKPSKQTVIAFAIALELSIEETEALLKSAGFALSHNNLFDLIIEFYIINGVYDIFEINSALYQYDQQLLGSL